VPHRHRVACGTGTVLAARVHPARARPLPVEKPGTLRRPMSVSRCNVDEAARDHKPISIGEGHLRADK
jgi:hypothetical protein